ncbi:MAG: hypothetical protein WBQ49_00925, partial [Rhodomicrobium sp.]
VQGQPGAPVPALGDIMGKIQFRHIKLWYAIKERNWGLMDYELDQIKDSFNNAVILYRNIPVEFIVAADEPLSALQKAANMKDGSKLERDYAALTAACNSCHKAAGVGFIVMKTPTSFPFGDQEIAPQRK